MLVVAQAYSRDRYFRLDSTNPRRLGLRSQRQAASMRVGNGSSCVFTDLLAILRPTSTPQYDGC